MRQNNARNFSIDVLNCICILVVLAIHYPIYINPSLRNIPFGALLINFSLGGFVFLSAYKLTKYKIKIKLSSFLINRVVKLYPLYILALILFKIIIYPQSSFLLFIKQLFLFQIITPVLFGQFYFTLYFVSMIFIYYFIFIVLRQYLTNLKKFIPFSLLIYFIVLILHKLKLFRTELVDPRFFIYYFYFIFGMVYAYYGKKMKNYFNFVLLIFLFLTFVFQENINLKTTHISTNYWNFLIHVPLVIIHTKILGVKWLFLHKTNVFKNMITKLSYAVYVIFLFHNPILRLLNNSYYDSNLTHTVYLLTFGPVLIFTTSFYLQKNYDRLLSMLTKK